MKRLLTVTKKEIKENFRDRRVIFNSLIFGPLLFPALFLGLLAFTASKQAEKAEKPLELPIAGQHNAPNMVAFLKQQGVIVEDAPEDPEAAVRQQDEDVIVRIPDNFGELWNAGKAAPVEVIADDTRQNASTSIRRVKGLLQAYSSQIGVLRLQLRGVSPGLMSPIQVKDVDLSTPTSRSAQVLAFLPYVLMITAFIGGMHLAMDTTAGEKERRSLEPLLMNPVARWKIMSGKLLATTLFAFLALTITLVAFSYAITLMPADLIGMTLNLPWRTVGIILAIVMPVALLGSALLTILASFAKSFREAQSYMGLVMLVPMIPSLWLMVNPVKPESWMMWVPLLSQNVLINELVRGEAVASSWMVMSIVATTLFGLVLALIAANLYNRTRLIFSDA